MPESDLQVFQYRKESPWKAWIEAMGPDLCVQRTTPSHPQALRKVDLLEGVETSSWLGQQRGHFSSPGERGEAGLWGKKSGTSGILSGSCLHVRGGEEIGPKLLGALALLGFGCTWVSWSRASSGQTIIAMNAYSNTFHLLTAHSKSKFKSQGPTAWHPSPRGVASAILLCVAGRKGRGDVRSKPEPDLCQRKYPSS